MNIIWHDSAVFELEEAALYYGGVDDELGLSFIAEARGGGCPDQGTATDEPEV